MQNTVEYFSQRTIHGEKTETDLQLTQSATTLMRCNNNFIYDPGGQTTEISVQIIKITLESFRKWGESLKKCLRFPGKSSGKWDHQSMDR